MSEESIEIRTARLRLSSPEAVYQALEQEADKDAGRGWQTKPWEPELETRPEPLVQLALAHFGFDSEIVDRLYKRAMNGTSDEAFDRAVRLACLANRCCPGTFGDGGVDAHELARLAAHGEVDELYALFGNPSRRWLLQDLYDHKGFAADLPPERWLVLVRASTENDGLGEEHDTDESPDLELMRIHGSLLSMLRTVPVEADWMDALYQILLKVDPKNCAQAGSMDEVREILDRWKGLKVVNRFSRDQEEVRGVFSGFTRVDEFRAIVASLYGRRYADQKSEWLGDANHPDPVYRCAHYGRTALNKEVVAAVLADFGPASGAWLLAVLLNPSLYRDRTLRAQVEPILSRAHVRQYRRLCGLMRRQNEWFDPRPVTDQRGGEWDEVKSETGDVARPADARDLAQLTAEMATLRTQLVAVSKTVSWLAGGLVVAIVLLLWRH